MENLTNAFIELENYVNKIMAFADTPFVKVITGVRRCGKSTIMQMLMQELHKKGVSDERIISIRFDSMEYEGMTAKQLYEMLKSKISENEKTYLFLDEVQEIESWEKAVNSINTDYDVDIYVTGSNSRMMSSEISTYLTGRYVSFRVFTLSFAEYLNFKKQYTTIDDVHKELVSYIKYGGFPAIHLQEYPIDDAYTIVKDIYNSTIFSDIVRRNQVRKVDQLERIVKFVFDNVGRTFSAKSISDYLKSENRTIDNETVYNYLEKLEKAYILHRCSRYDLKGKELLKTQEKFYLADTSLRYCVLGYHPDTVASSLENIVYLELCRRGYDVKIGKYDTGEIDFVAEKQGDKIYIQVTQELSSEATIHREYDRLLEIKDNYPKYVLSIDDYSGGNYNGIQTMHIADFLLLEKL